MARLLVRRPGLLTTIQDLGRPGLGRWGVSPSGAMDALALRVANRLVGNAEGAPALEITVVGPEIVFEDSVSFALAGAHLTPTLDAKHIEPWRSYLAEAGETLAFGPRRQGARCYLAVAGGFEAKVVLGSFATDIESHLGGLGGALHAGQKLLTRPAAPSRPSHARLSVLHAYSNPFELRFVPEESPHGPREVIGLFAESAYTISPRSNRMGYRLEGPTIESRSSGEMTSEPVPPATIQLPPGGQPILLMADRPTVGGYPRLGGVIAADLPKAGQLWIGHRVRFVAVTLPEAHAALRAQRAALAEAVAPC
jgi:antagonist of KipI